jgi:hypothetical protein
MNNRLERGGRKRPWPNLKYHTRHLSGGTEEKYGKRQSGQPISGSRSEPDASRT